MTCGRGKRRVLLAICLAGTMLFTALGIWQVQRLGWKRDLIARVDARVHASPIQLPASGDWPVMDLHDWEYRPVRVNGRFLHERETLVDAVTALGPGSWVVTPLRTAEGVVLVNRGFVPQGLEDSAARSAGQSEGEVTITGLLRRSEPHGRVLRSNDRGADRWFSRDVAAIAAARGLHQVAPFFVDAEAGSHAIADAGSLSAATLPDGVVPRGGLTVVRFRNAHLVYALTWFTLAGMCLVGVALLSRRRA